MNRPASRVNVTCDWPGITTCMRLGFTTLPCMTAAKTLAIRSRKLYACPQFSHVLALGRFPPTHPV